MRSKEVENAIIDLEEFRKTGYHTLMLKCDNNRIRANTKLEITIDTVLNYIFELEKEVKDDKKVIEKILTENKLIG